VVRAGGYALTLLSVPLNVEVLRTLEPGPTPLVDLRIAVGLPPQTTLRKQLHDLARIGVVERRQHAGFPGPVDYALGQAGQELLGVARFAAAWLGNAPAAEVKLGSSMARSALRALVDGWSAAIVRALASRPISLTELDRLIPSLSYPAIERRLAALRMTGQILACDRLGGGGRRPYEATRWLREAVVPLIAAAAWERRSGLGDVTTPITRLEVESAFLLALPLLRLESDLAGCARLIAEFRGGDDGPRLAGVSVRVDRGRVVECGPRPAGTVDAWGSGSVDRWLAATLCGDSVGLEVGGDRLFAQALIDGLHDLFSALREGHLRRL
jgi:DNA-binding HxlR family transcriptional regulator